MAALSESERRELWAKWMTDNTDTIDITKQDLRAAVDATDNWIDDNAALYNAALPQPARSQLSAKQKTLLFMAVAAKRFGVI